MEKQWDGQAAPGGTPDADALALINRLAKTPLAAEQVYHFAVRLCDNDIDRDNERFDEQALTDMAPLFLGKAGLFDHQWSARQQVARLYRAEVAQEPGKTTRDGRPYLYLKGYAYMLRGPAADPLIADIEGGIKREVSVGLSCAKTTCSVCGKTAGACAHEKGKRYEDALCHLILSAPTDAYEWSFVAVPAQPQAGVLKAARAPHRADAPGETLLRKEAALGRRYAAELTREVRRLSALCALPQAVTDLLPARLEAEELAALRDALRQEAFLRCPASPQLPNLAHTSQPPFEPGADFMA
ncbi:MAG: hypothetical protein LBT60_04960 [Oscillospiraceae bacterium]|jgi:hypothetical protein|nr:hypothetical protein [Oscillospiraceae bacterium]